MSYAPNSREVIIDRGAMGFGFTLRHPVAGSGGGGGGSLREPTYRCGALVRSVEERGPASRGGLDKDEVVAAVNNEIVHGKSYLQVINMIQATSRRLTLKVLPTSSLEEIDNCSAVAVGTRGLEAMEDVSAEKENQLLVPRTADRRSCVSEPSPSSSWRHSPPSTSSIDIPVLVPGEPAGSSVLGGPADHSGLPFAPPSADTTATAVEANSPSSGLLRELEFAKLTRDSEAPAVAASGDDDLSASDVPFAPSSRQHRPSTSSCIVVAVSSSPSSSSSPAGGSNFSGAKAIGLTRSSGQLYSGSGGGEARGPVITVKKAYQPHTVTNIAVRESVSSGSGDNRLSSSSAGSPTQLSHQQQHQPVRPTFEYGATSYERGLRGLHAAQAAEPRINYKKRKSGATGGGGGGGSLTGSRAQSVGHLPGGTQEASLSGPPPRIIGIAQYQPGGGGGVGGGSGVGGGNGGSPLTASKHRLGTSSTHNILTSMPSASRHRVASPPSAERESGVGGGSVGITLMHSPLRRGSSPARSIATPVAPLSGAEDVDSNIGSGGSSALPAYHETRFSMVQDHIVSNVYTGRQRGRFESGEASALPSKPSALSRVTWQSQPRSSQQRMATDGAPPTSSALLSHSSSATVQIPSYTSSALAPSSYLLQQPQLAMETSSGNTNCVTYTTTVTSSCRSRNQLARTQFMEAKPTVPPALPLPKVASSPPTVRAAAAAEGTSGAGESPSGSVTRRDSYINAVKTNRSTMLSPEAIDESEEQDDGGDSPDGSDHHDAHSHSLQKAKRFFGESWTRRSGKNKTPKMKEALASGGKESLGVGGAEKKFYLSVKVIRDDGKEPKSKSWKSFSLTIENDVMYLMRERKESSASSSSSVEDVPSPIPLRQCHFEWTAPDAQSRKKYLVCRMIVNPASPPDSTSSLAGSVPTTSHSTPEPVSSTVLHGTSPPSSEGVTGPGPSGGVSEYKLQFLDSEQMHSFYNCLPLTAASVSVIGGPTDFSATYPPGPKAAKKAAVKSAPAATGRLKKMPQGATELELAMLAGEMDFAGALSSFPSHSKTKLKALVKNIRSWKSSSTESTTTTSTCSVSRTMRYEEYSMRQRSVSPDEAGRPLPGCTFGVPLTQVPRSSVSPYVPFVVELCTKIVETCGLHCVGVYRVSPKKAVIDALEAELNDCGSRLDLIDRSNERWNDVHAVSGLLKCFLRKMPDPLFPHSLYREFVNASNRNLAHERKMLLLQRLLALMESDESGHPEYKHHRETLLYLVQHLRRVASHAHVNKMNAKNLASMIAPNVFRAPDVTNPAMIMESTTHGATILELVLNHHEWIFSTDLDTGRMVPPPVTYDIGHNIAETCGGEHEQEGSSHNIDDALGGAEDTGATNRSDVFEYKPGENGRDILTQLLDAAIACQGEVSPEAAASSVPDEGGFDEVDIDAAVRRRQQLDAAAAAAAAAGTTSSGDTTPAASGSTNGSGCKAIAEELSGSRLADYSHARRGSASLHDADASAAASAEWRQLAQRAEMALAASANDLRASPGVGHAGGRWFGAMVQPLEDEYGRTVPPPPLPPRLYDADAERRRLGSPCDSPCGLESSAVRHQRQMSKSLDSLTASAPPEPTKAPPFVDRQASAPVPHVPPRSSAVAALKRQRMKAPDGLQSTNFT